MKTISGEPLGIKSDVVGRLSAQRVSLSQRKGVILVTETIKATDVGYAAIVTTTSPRKLIPFSVFYVSEFSEDNYSEGDIVCLTPSGNMLFLWEVEQSNNALFLTESCSCRCVMCPQPPAPHDPIHVETAMRVLELVSDGYDGEICITGGEPTLCGDDFLTIVSRCRSKHPKSRIIVLTNGKTFSDFDFTKSVAELDTGAIFAVSLHADTDDLHDEIVGAKGSFRKTQKGLYNLAKLKQAIEIRVVVSKLNYARLREISEHVFRNYPFAFHVTFMAMEVTGLAVDNLSKIWIDPYDYRKELEAALHELHRRGMTVSAYNHPLCLSHRGAWKFARQSISTWKNDYLPECESCSLKEECCGVFTTSGEYLSSNIKSIPI